MTSILDSNLTNSAIELWLELSVSSSDSFKENQLLTQHTGAKKSDIENLIAHGYLINENGELKFPHRGEHIKLIVSSIVHPFLVHSESNEFRFNSVKNYLISVQKQLSHFETEGKKSFLTLRSMVEKVVMQAKDYLNISFQGSSKEFIENNQWVNIPHVSPIGIYEPIGEIRKKFEVIMKELDISIINLVESHLTQLSDLIQPMKSELNSQSNNNSSSNQLVGQINDHLISINKMLNSSKIAIRGDISKFSEEVHNAVKIQFTSLEENLGKDLIEQFDAIERLNELDPQRIRIKLEQTINELNVHLNSIYSRLLREINTLQSHLDVSKINIILTNEAGKLLKKISDEEQLIEFNKLQQTLRNIQNKNKLV